MTFEKESEGPISEEIHHPEKLKRKKGKNKRHEKEMDDAEWRTEMNENSLSVNHLLGGTHTIDGSVVGMFTLFVLSAHCSVVERKSLSCPIVTGMLLQFLRIS